MDALVQHKSIKHLISALGSSADLHLVGGCIRDSLVGLTPKDLDLATRFTPEEVEESLKKANIHYIITGIRRGTITAIIEDQPFEITTFRNPANEKEFVDKIEIDLAARDFTINAIALSLNTGQLIDPYGGISDLKNNILTCVGSPARRFVEDPHRLIRMVRFGPGQARSIHPDTKETAMKLASLTQSVALERVHDELIKIVCSDFPREALHLMQQLGLLKIFLPELEATVGVSQNHFHRYDVFEHILHAVENTPKSKIPRLAAMLHDIGKPSVKSIDEKGIAHFYQHEEPSADLAKEALTRLKFSNEDIEKVWLLVRNHGFSTSGSRPSIRRLLNRLGKDLVEDLLHLKKADMLAGHTHTYVEEILKFESKVKEEISSEKFLVKLDLTGNDVMDYFNVPEGMLVGKFLKFAKKAVLEDPDLNKKDILLELLKNNIDSILD